MTALRTVSNALHQGFDVISRSSQYAKQGFLIVGDKTSQVLYDFKSIDGIEKIISETIAICNFTGKGVLLAATLREQKNLIYATKWIASPANYFKGSSLALPTLKRFDEPVFQPGLPVLRPMPPKNPPKKDIFKICMDIANFLEAIKFIQVNVYSFPWIQQKATEWGNIQVLGIYLKQIPILQCAFDKPKEIFIIVGSASSLCVRIKALFATVDPQITTQRNRVLYVENPARSVSNYLGIVGDAGRLLLVGLSRTKLGKHRVFVYIELVTRTAGIVKFIFDRELERKKQEIRILNGLR